LIASFPEFPFLSFIMHENSTYRWHYFKGWLHFEYKEGNLKYTMSQRTMFIEEWDLKDHFEFINGIVKKIPKYQEVVSMIMKRYGVDESQVTFWMDSLLSKFNLKALEEINDEALIEYVTVFMRDLENGLIEWEITIWIKGVWIQNDEYKIYEGLWLRSKETISVSSLWMLLPAL